MRREPLRLPTGSSILAGPRACLVALTHCGRVVAWSRADGQLAHEWATAMRLAGWQVGTLAYAELLEAEPACQTCRFQRACLEARQCQASGNLGQTAA